MIKYIAFHWPDYHRFTEEPWFKEECYQDKEKDVCLIPEFRCLPCPEIEELVKEMSQ